MATSFPSLSVLIPVRNDKNHLAQAVESVLKQKYEGELEIILAVGPSIDDSLTTANQLAASNKLIQVIENPKGLTTAGLNLAIAKAKGEIIVRVDAHSELGDNYLSRGVEILQSTNSVLVGGIMQAKGKTPFQKAVAFGYGSRFGLGGGRYHVGGQAGVAESAYLGIFLASALKEVSGYDESIIRGEDWDLSQRLKARGGKVWFTPELVVTYWPRSNFRALAWQFYSTGIWRGDLTRRAPGKASLRYFIPPLALLALVDFVILYMVGAIPITFLITPVAAYLFLVSFAAATAKQLALVDRLAVLVALPVMHLSWAIGFWIGLAFGARKTIDAGDKK